MNMKTCNKCGETKEFSKNKNNKDGLQNACKSCMQQSKKKWRANNPESHKQSYTKSNLKNSYNITLEEYDQMLMAQKGCCKICSRHHTEFKRALAVDHCHETGKIRALLCFNCNSVLGYAKEDTNTLKSAIKYLKQHGK